MSGAPNAFIYTRHVRSTRALLPGALAVVPAGDCSVPLGLPWQKQSLIRTFHSGPSPCHFPDRADTFMLTSGGDLSGRLRLTSYPEQTREKWRAAAYAIFTCC